MQDHPTYVQGPELKGSVSMIRELHVYGTAVAVNTK